MTKLLSTDDTQALGVLLEVNRQLLHSRGLAFQLTRQIDSTQVHTLVFYREGIEKFLELTTWMRQLITVSAPNDAERWSQWLDDIDARMKEALEQPNGAWLRIIDGRDDPEGFYFEEIDDEDLIKAKRFENLQHERAAARQTALGFVVQPLEVTQK